VRISRHILAASEARGYAVVTAQARYLYAVSGCHWFAPIEEDVQHAYAARDPLLRGGDLQSTCFTYYPAVFALMDCGPTLDDVTSEVEAALAFCTRTGNHAAAAVHRVYQQFGRAMRGLTAEPGSFADASFDEDAHEAINPRVRTHLHIIRALSAALFGDTERLVRHAETAMRLFPLVKSLYPSVVAHLVGALALAHRARTADRPQRPALLAELDGYRDWLARRAHDAPGNFQHLVWLVDAERALAVDDFRAAAAAFDAGLREVGTRQRPWHRALIAERAGLFHLAQGMQTSGRRLLAEARLHYDAWGATGKVRELDRVHPFLRHMSAPANDLGPYTDDRQNIKLSSHDIDLLAILRASQALGSETDFDRLYASVVEQMSAITGATTVQLLIRDDDAGDWVVPTPVPDRQAVVPIQEAATRGLLPMVAVRYIERTGQPLLVENAVRDDRFARDLYFTGVDRCSLLGLPIVNQGKLRAVLLLENRLSSGAFSADRLEAVLLISGQLAASLDNALLYRRLEAKVAERTRALQVVNEQLETLSLTDPLTGLANRRRFDDALEVGWRDAIASGRSIGVAFVDIDHFKWYNDDFGHLAGDDCLREVAQALAGAVREGSDLVCRYGGEEFAIICPGADQARAVTIAERCRTAVAALARRNTRTSAGLITVSVGVAAMEPNAELSADTLVKVADTALYRAKQNGRNLVSTASDIVSR
jgi:diguanylate cyclase (GGDEF)-like protein